jgi:hypothetical protein
VAAGVPVPAPVQKAPRCRDFALAGDRNAALRGGLSLLLADLAEAGGQQRQESVPSSAHASGVGSLG